MNTEDTTLDVALAFLDEFDPTNDHLDEDWFEDLASPDRLLVPTHYLTPRNGAVSLPEDQIVENAYADVNNRQRPEALVDDTTTDMPSSSSSSVADDDEEEEEDDESQEDKVLKHKKMRKRIREDALPAKLTSIDGHIRHNARRLSKREELKALRAQTIELEATLATMKDVALNRHGRASTIVSTKLPLPSLGLWEKVASRQLRARRDVEQENARLKVLVESQRRVARNLRRAIRKRAIAQTIEDGIRLKHRNLGLSPDKVVLDDLVAGMDELYVGVDKVIDVHEGSRCNPTLLGRRYHIQEDAQLGYQLIFTDQKLVPFDIRVVEKAMWHEAQELNCKAQGTNSRSDMITQCFLVPYRHNGDNADIKMTQVTRRYIEQNRIVLVAQTLIEPTPVDVSLLIPGFAFRERRWHVLTKGEDHVSGATTSIQSHTIITAYVSGTSIPLPIETFHGVASKWDQSFERRDGQLEGLLLDFAKLSV